MIGKFFERNRCLLKPFFVIFSIYLFGISAILLAGVHYADDAARTNYGYAGWSAFSRYLSTILSHGLHADNYLTNIAPLPQILGAGLLAISSVILILVVCGREIFKEKWTKWIIKIIAVVPLGLCPYMLECLSYQYDAVYMGLSVLFSVMPFIFYRKERWKFVAASIVGILGVCMTYQASIGIYPMLVAFISMKDWGEGRHKNKKIFENIIVSAVIFLLSLVFFQKVLMTSKDIYVSNELPGIAEFFPSLFSHLLHYFELLISDFKTLWLVLIAIMMVGFVILYVARSKKNKLASFIVGVLGLFLMALSTYILYAALDTPLYTTRAMYAVGTLVAIIGVYIVSGKLVGKVVKKYLGKRTEISMEFSVKIGEVFLSIPVVILAWCFFSFSFTYGNALKEQNEFRNMQIGMVISDANEILPALETNSLYIQTEGQIDFAPAISHMPENEFRLIRRLLKPSFGDDTYWMAYRLTEASGISELKFSLEVDLREKDLPILKETVLYNIYGSSDGILVKFKGTSFWGIVDE